MCLIIKNKESRPEITTTDDLRQYIEETKNYLLSQFKKLSKSKIVFKTIKGKGESLYYSFKYKPLIKNSVDLYDIISDSYIGNEEICLDYGFHSRPNLLGICFNNSIFIIPKGSNYIEGSENSVRKGIVSDNIIYIGHIFNPITYFRLLFKKYK